jgi:hypothetical protein
MAHLHSAPKSILYPLQPPSPTEGLPRRSGIGKACGVVQDTLPDDKEETFNLAHPRRSLVGFSQLLCIGAASRMRMKG